jgi:hypothetical protein
VHTHTHPDAAGAQVLELPRRGLSIGENARDGNRGGGAGQSAFTLDSSSTSSMMHCNFWRFPGIIAHCSCLQLNRAPRRSLELTGWSF